MEEKIKQAELSGLLYLSYKRLKCIPEKIFEIDKLYRLDLGYNYIKEIPDEISNLVHLESLWLNNNPLKNITKMIYKCKKLKEIDLTSTDIISLPYELGRLENIILIDVQDTKLLKSKYKHTTTSNLISYLHYKDEKKMLSSELTEKLKNTIYNDLSDDKVHLIKDYVKEVLKEFNLNEDIKNLISNAERTFPKKINDIIPKEILSIYLILKKENDVKKLAAEMELKIRNIYFDRIDPTIVEDMVHSITKEIKTLEDMQFLLKHAKIIFPKHAKDVNAIELYKNMILLREKLERERKECVNMVIRSVSNIYSDIEPAKIEDIVHQVVHLIKEINDLKNLAANATLYFPNEFLNIIPIEIKRKLLNDKNIAKIAP